MKEIIFNRKNYISHKDFYHDLCIQLEKERFIDWRGKYEDLGYSADLLWEFLGYCDEDFNKYVFIGFDKEKIKEQKNYDDYKYNIAINVFEDFVQEYPNNILEFRDEE